MRKIILKTVELKDGAGRTLPDLDYAQAFSQIVCGSGNSEGMTVAEMSSALEIKRVMDNANKSNGAHVMLEEAQWSYLNNRLQNNRFPFASEAIVEMVLTVEHAEKVDPNEKAKAK